MRPLCLNCNRCVAHEGYRGLCRKCFNVESVRVLFPRRGRTFRTEPTEAELDALIAEQMRHLPPWWDDETAGGYGR